MATVVLIKLAIFYLLSLVQAINYVESEALRELNLCEAAYCVASLSDECKNCPSDVTLTAVVTQSTSGGRALIGYDETDNHVFVAYRGSENTRNWIENVKFVKTSPYNDFPSVSVELGFYDWYTDLNATGVYSSVISTAAKYSTTKLKVTGHSAGGACATLFAFDAIRGIFSGLTLTKSTTFGSPRVGDDTFASTFESQATFDSIRVTHYRDMVPHLPMQKALKFHHIATEVFYADEDSTYYKICDGTGEDDDCSNSCYPLHCTSVSDHLYYLNTTIGSDGCSSTSSTPRILPRVRHHHFPGGDALEQKEEIIKSA
mmetsp:Transcript_13528/g.18053  ORF Transcript_13528/g.18053 Transcript_13528/m.18053 type:complete len:316 (-) Transcript_13528:288-1235(-)